MTAPPRLASWLLDAAVPTADGEAIAGDLYEEFREHVMPTRGPHYAQWWYCWQVVRSLAPLFVRSWQRASLTRASAAMIGAALTATLPAVAALMLRTFVLQQVPLKTTAELSSAFATALAVLVAATLVLSVAVATRLLQPRKS